MRIFHVYYPTRTIVLPLSEALIVSASFLIATAIVVGRDTFLVLNYEDGILKIVGLTGITLLCSYYFDLYAPQSITARWEIYFRLLLVLGLLAILLSAAMFVYPQIAIGRYILPLGLILLTTALVAWRSAYERIISSPMFREHVYVLGDGELAHRIADTIRTRKDSGMELIGTGKSAEEAVARNELRPHARSFSRDRRPVDRVIVAFQDRRDKLPIAELLRLRFEGVVIEEAGTLLERLSGRLPLDQLRPSSLIYADGFRLKPTQQMSRRVASMFAAAVGLILFLPFFPIVVALVRLSSSGPILFRQTRVGLRNQNFTVLKFRTMIANAEATGAKWATKDDPRVTRIGRFMRKTRLDEVPQLWNVLRGDMNLVGPRPERPEFVPLLSKEMPYYHLRHMIRPGLTGWAQVRYGYGGTVEQTRHKLEFDLYYLKHMSLGLDLLIMFQTVKTIVRRRGAQ
jgi:sugar transferase (PEP-CTERM system associated)